MIGLKLIWFKKRQVQSLKEGRKPAFDSLKSVSVRHYINKNYCTLGKYFLIVTDFREGYLKGHI
ncbi:MAG: hypothetical protein B6247_08465 [Candidatus Parabeggiatoa sp. nov. 2]|nr:MAG: hypothetical protein B6247_08465 [Beggiatoa sp. 4572_84]